MLFLYIRKQFLQNFFGCQAIQYFSRTVTVVPDLFLITDSFLKIIKRMSFLRLTLTKSFEKILKFCPTFNAFADPCNLLIHLQAVCKPLARVHCSGRTMIANGTAAVDD